MLDGEVGVSVTVKNEDAIERVTGPNGDEWRSQFYPLYTRDDVLGHFAYNAVANAVRDAKRLDGWADLADGDVTMRVESVGYWTVSNV